jgi:hypothetical protein
MIAKLQSEIDERQALVDAVITPSTPIEEPVDGQ